MLIKAREEDRIKLLDYCKEEAVFNIFIIGDIENFGFSSPYQDVWYEEKDRVIRGIALRYHDNLIVYSKDLDMDFTLIPSLLKENAINIISGKQEVIDSLVDYLGDETSRNDLNFARHQGDQGLGSEAGGLIVASEKDAMEIAQAYGEIEEFKNLYSEDLEERHRQIRNRIKSGEGKHLMIKDKRGILAHGNTSAENTVSAMIGGVFTREDMRGKGYKEKIISSLIQDLKDRNKEIGLFYKDEEEGIIYKNLGFEKIGIWSIIGREKYD